MRTVVFEELDRHDSDALAVWYESYRHSFPHDDEREQLEDFKHILDMNHDAVVQNRFGPYREFVLAMRDVATGEIVGGLNFGATTSDKHKAAGFAASVQAIFFFVDKRYRQRHVYRRRIEDEIKIRALSAFPPDAASAADVAIFFEANNPAKMNPIDIWSDRDNSGLDTYRRYHMWLEVGAHPLAFDYVQPPLSSTKQSVPFLQLFYLGKGDHLSSAMVIEHLYRFISISVLKGEDADTNKDYQAMKTDLQRSEVIDFIPRNDPEIEDIEREADRRKQRALATQRRFVTITWPGASTEPDKFSLVKLAQGMALKGFNGIYRRIYQLYHQLERWHIRVVYVEIAVGVFGLAAPLITWWATDWSEAGRHYAELLVVVLLCLYTGSRGLVRLRRLMLGHRFASLWRQIALRRMQLNVGPEGPHAWLRQELSSFVAAASGAGYVIGPDRPYTEEDNQRILRMLSERAAAIYSDWVWGVADQNRQQEEFQQLRNWLTDFPLGLWRLDSSICPNYHFYSLIIPIKAPTKYSRLEMAGLTVDQKLRQTLVGSGMRTPDAASGPPCFLILRQIALPHRQAAFGTSRVKLQLGLMATTLLHLGDLLARVAQDGDLKDGLPKDSTIIIASANYHGARILEWLGFELLQRSLPHEGVESDPQLRGPGNLVQANLNFYAMVGNYFGLGPEGQRLIELTSHLRDALLTSARSSGSRPA